MTPRRIIAAAAAILTVLVLQATLLTPLTAPLLVSLPAVVIAAIGIEAGPSAGMSIGFSAGLLADLASRHPAGVLALAWLLLGTACGLFAGGRRRAIRSIVIVTVAVGVVSLGTAVALSLLAMPATPIATLIRLALPSAGVDALLAFVVVPPVRAVLRAHGVRVPWHRRARPPAAGPVLTSRMAAEGRAR